MDETRGYFYIFVLLVGIALGIMFMQPATVVRQDGAAPGVGTGKRTVVINSTAGSPLVPIFQAVQDSVVAIRTDTGSQGVQGSGFIFDRRGYIVTNHHVVEGATEVQAIPLGNLSDVQVGERVAAIGNPFGLSGSMTAGIISQTDRLLRMENRFSIPGVLQTDAAINPGNSGGPLLNMNGTVIGVNTAIQSRSGTFNGVGFAVSVATVKRVVPDLIRTGEYEHPWIGVSGYDVTPEIATAMNLDRASGFLVARVVDGSPADRAGLQGGTRNATIDGRRQVVGGDVIVAIDGRKVRQIADILNYLARHASVDDRITLTVLRDGERKQVRLTLARRPDPG
ncbi:MAG: S1C family serine protease [Candidatus Nanohaloarchaea archaeon]